MKRYFSNDPEGCGLQFHATAAQARAAAQRALGEAEDASCEGWGENVDEISWGVVLEAAAPRNERPDPSGEYDALVDYELEALPAEPSGELARFQVGHSCDFETGGCCVVVTRDPAGEWVRAEDVFELLRANLAGQIGGAS